MYELTVKDKTDIIDRLTDLCEDRGDRAEQAAADEDYGMASWWAEQAQQIQRLVLKIEESIGGVYP